MNNLEKNRLTLMLGRCVLVYAVFVLIISFIYAPASFFWNLLLSISIFIVGVVILLIPKREEDLDACVVDAQRMKFSLALFISIFLGSFTYLFFSPSQEISAFGNLLIVVGSAFFGNLFSYLLLLRREA